MVKVCIVGAGVIGLTTAWQVVQQIKDATVYVVADNFTTETTSHGAAGIICPQIHISRRYPDYKRLCLESWQYFNDIVKNGIGREAGVSVVDGYQLYEEDVPEENEYFKSFVYHFSSVNPDSLEFIPTTCKIVKAYHFTTLLVECRNFLPYLMKKLRERGVTFLKRHITDFYELAVEDFDLIFNCAALGNRLLMNDKEMYVARGQVLRVRAPWIKQFVIYGDYTYIFPGQDLCVLGGTHQDENENLKIDENDRKSILDRCISIFPSLADAEIDHEWVGLRPYRNTYRIEEGESLEYKGKRCRIIHNYG